ncbi:MAG: hypothetical protein N2323_04795 [candidate division WOR-3 bacterium]|nr:hypothetical protein [candidate division WOR-3 bacterium]MCX7837259.1 hypothetical protein [candidate division WOR-3 bacterium]MDW8114512.1 hypothetical protein [candidate division WOR-3 bacterium]
MNNVIFVINKKEDIYLGILNYLKENKKKIILLGFPEKGEEEREYWHFLFSICEKLECEKIPFSVGMERGSLFNILELARAISAELIILPKSKFLLLGEEYEDFLKELEIPILIY